MSLAAVGSLVATAMIAGINSILDRNFAREWSESLRVKHRERPGEVEIARLLAEKHKTENLESD
jgi:putative membrane protein